MSEEGGFADGLPLDVKDWDLPRIVIEDDRIIVFDEDWVEKNVSGEEEEPSIVDSILSEVFGKGLSVSDGGKEGEEEFGDLEENVGVLKGKGERASDFYKVKSGEEFYDSGLYSSGVYNEGKEDLEYIKISEVEVVEDGRRSERSVLEISGFVDEEAEKKRDDIRDLYSG